MHKVAISSDSHVIDAGGETFFYKGFLHKNLKSLFYLAFNYKAHGFDLAIVRGAGCDEESWCAFRDAHVDDQTGDLSAASRLWGRVYRGTLTLYEVCQSYDELKAELDKVCKGLDLAPASLEHSENEIILSDVLWEDYDYDRSNHIDYFFYWLSDRDGQEFFSYIFDQLKDRIAHNEPELSIFFHDSVERSLVEESLSYWTADNSVEEMQAAASIFGNWNADNKTDDPSRRMKNLGYISDFENEEWAEDIVSEENWLVFIGGSRIKYLARFIVPKACPLISFVTLLRSLGYSAKVKSLSKQKDILELKIRW